MNGTDSLIHRQFLSIQATQFARVIHKLKNHEYQPPNLDEAINAFNARYNFKHSYATIEQMKKNS
jgi:hypothetical protein